jgi:SAM-dependent methyltransferase
MQQGSNAQQRRYWSEIAGPHWVERQHVFDRIIAPHGEAVLELLDAQPGERVLDVGCGFGTTALDVAATVGSGGAVHGVDISLPMIERARQRVAIAGHDHVRFQVADAQVDDLTAGSLQDAAVSRFGVMFFDDPTAAFANIRTSVRVGGRLAFVCWQGPGENRFFTLAGSLIRPALADPPPPPDPDAPGPMAFSDPQRVAGLLGDAGWGDIDISALRLPMRFAEPGADGLDEAVDQMMNSELGRLAVAQLDASRLEALVTMVRSQLADHRIDGTVQFESSVWLVSAVR